MNEDTPFKSRDNPYRRNPFKILDVTPDMGQAGIEAFAESKEKMIAAGLQPTPGLELQPGECRQAAQRLQDPVLRLAFDLMLRWPETDDKEQP